MNTVLDINTDIRDCTYLFTERVNGGKMITYLIPESAVVDCSLCDEFAEYYIYITARNEMQDLCSCLCLSHFNDLSRLKQLDLPIAVVH